MTDEQDVEVKVNWHELRILGIWAEQWAAATKDKVKEDPQRLVAIICGRLQAQHPDLAPLTMSGEIAELRRAAEQEGWGEIEVHGFDEDAEANEDER